MEVKRGEEKNMCSSRVPLMLSGPGGRVSLIHSIKHKDDFARDLLIAAVER